VAYLLIGKAKLPADRLEKQQFITDLIMRHTPGDLGAAGRSTDWPDWLGSLVTLTRNLGALPMLPNNQAELLTDYQGMIDAMIRDIDAAERYVHVEFFILVLDETTAPFFDALARARERGVTVRVLTDHLSQLTYPYRRATEERLEEMGAEFHS